MENTKTQMLRVRVTPEEKEKIIQLSWEHGFSGLSDYLRWAALMEDKTAEGREPVMGAIHDFQEDTSRDLGAIIVTLDNSFRVIQEFRDAAKKLVATAKNSEQDSNVLTDLRDITKGLTGLIEKRDDTIKRMQIEMQEMKKPQQNPEPPPAPIKKKAPSDDMSPAAFAGSLLFAAALFFSLIWFFFLRG